MFSHEFHKIIYNVMFFLTCIFSGPDPYAADLLREQEMADEILQRVDRGEVVWLKDGEKKFLGLYRETISKRMQGAVILLHGFGLNPNAAIVVRPLRDYLSDHGWSTLSLQMPVSYTGATVADSFELVPATTQRISAGLEFLKNRKIVNIAIIGHGFGAVFAIHYLANQSAPIVRALVIIGLSMPLRASNGPSLSEAMVKIDSPILDIDIFRQQPWFQKTLKERRKFMKNKEGYRQMLIEGADNQFRDSGMILEKRIYSWLMKVAPGTEIRK